MVSMVLLFELWLQEDSGSEPVPSEWWLQVDSGSEPVPSEQ